GYGRTGSGVQVVAAGDGVAEVGDEPMLMFARGLPIAVGAHRAEAIAALLAAYPRTDVVISDDGLQHYAMRRDIEIVVVHGERAFGNGWLLPAGPLRERRARVREADALLINAPRAQAVMEGCRDAFHFTVIPEAFVGVRDSAQTVKLEAFAGKRAHAIAGIGHPEPFFSMLRTLGIDVLARRFPDHHRFLSEDLPRDAELILMTEKDAVKCQGFADERCWFLRVKADLDPALIDFVHERLRRLAAARSAAPAHA
ncbi:MAG: tetraacyldisaccharide 4'-kinase, partial [Pseudomonadota bacterium]|nr:tetraacyldisaccharide 4'-kinase [Pseudomonadota bacterium]